MPILLPCLSLLCNLCLVFSAFQTGSVFPPPRSRFGVKECYVRGSICVACSVLVLGTNHIVRISKANQRWESYSQFVLYTCSQLLWFVRCSHLRALRFQYFRELQLNKNIVSIYAPVFPISLLCLETSLNRKMLMPIFLRMRTWNIVALWIIVR